MGNWIFLALSVTATAYLIVTNGDPMWIAINVGLDVLLLGVAVRGRR